MLSNAYFLAKFRFDTAENEPAKNLQNFTKFANFAPSPPNPNQRCQIRPDRRGLVFRNGEHEPAACGVLCQLAEASGFFVLTTHTAMSSPRQRRVKAAALLETVTLLPSSRCVSSSVFPITSMPRKKEHFVATIGFDTAENLGITSGKF